MPKIVQQPVNSRAGAREHDRFDQTALTAKVHSRYVHRDYAAHFFKWGWIARHIKTSDRILDVGCGVDTPLAHVLTFRSVVPAKYVGVDLNPIWDTAPTRKWIEYHEQYNFVDDWKDLLSVYKRRFTAIVNIEVIEHMSVPDARKMLHGFYAALEDGGRVYLSTPVFDGAAARNHIHEYEVPELQRLIESVGFVVEQRFGTFMNYNDMKKVATSDQRRLYEQLLAYYSHEVLSTFLAPLYPDQSRNDFWVLRKK